MKSHLRRWVRAAASETKDSWVDELGFFDLAHERSAMPIASLAAEREALVIAPPWTGKSTVAKHLAASHGLGDRFDFAAERSSAPQPKWLAQWKLSSDHALWVVDSADEARFTGRRVADALAWRAGLSGEQRDRLHVLVFARPNEGLVHDEIPDAKRFELLPIDRASAEAYVGAARFEKVVGHLRRLGGTDRAAQVRLLDALASWDEPTPTVSELRDFVFLQICREADAEGAPPGDAGRRRDVAARVAAVLLLTEQTHVAIDDSIGVPLAEVLGDLFRGHEATAAELKRTSLLARDASGHRFRQRYEQQQLAAFALRDVPLAALRPLLTGPVGGIKAPLKEVYELLLERSGEVRRPGEGLPSVGRREELAAWREARVPPLPAADALKVLDELAAVAAGPRPLWVVTGSRAFALLGAPELIPTVRTRLADATRPVAERALLLDMARARDWKALCPVAVRLALDHKEPSALRMRALLFVQRVGTMRQRTELDPIATRGPTALRAEALRDLVRRNAVAPMQAARGAPALQGGHFDGRALLVTEIAGRLSTGDAHEIVDAAVAGTTAGIDATVFEELLESAAIHVIDVADWSTADLDRVAWLFDNERRIEVSTHSLIAGRLGRDPEARRKFYARFLDDDRHLRLASAALTAADADFLLDVIGAAVAPSDGALADLLHLQRMLPDDHPTKPRIRAHIELRRRGWLASEEQRIEDAAREQAEYRAAQAAREAGRRAETRPLADVVEQILTTEQTGSRIAALGWVCFSDASQRPSNISGEFAELPSAVRERVFREMQEVVSTTEPTPIPASSGPFASNVLFEAAAISSLLAWTHGGTWLTDAVLRRWLPTLLFGAEDARTESVSICFRYHPESTVEMVATFVAREAHAASFPFAARVLPREIWMAPALAARVSKLVEDTEIDGKARGDLLRLFTARLPEAALVSLPTLATSDIAAAAIDCWMTISPTDALDALSDHLANPPLPADLKFAIDALEAATHAGASELAVDMKTWPTREIGRLAVLVARLVPFGTDPDYEGQAHFVSGEDRLRELRSSLLVLLTDRTGPEADAAIGDLAVLEPEVPTWVAVSRQRTRLQKMLDAMERGELVFAAAGS